ncbi:NUDIX domain-containing protein [Ruegeria sp. Ofav3-42]|uniref:NUDIX domain-containing protein n=1 Tax=Ruegeria sp. Ofav3-42 TaxID=2917759 RepID=UPI001EF4D516|nr:NUDIX hydrolase [Ruegeria sp. Ofav3-42]MCG7520434.1 NUDIX hydrolase [Ruegeria sp. Ofav3-42]
MIRRFGETPHAGRKYTRRPGVYALLPRGRGLLVTWYDDGLNPELQLPGGGIDPGESPITALHREVFEETGWLITAPRRFGAFRRFTYMPEYDLWAEKVCLIYRAQPVRRMGPPREEFHEARWMDTADAVEKLGNGGDRHFAGLHLKGLQ